MTTVAVRDGVMAADSARWRDNVHVGAGRKIVNHGGLLVGCAGDVHEIQAIHRWFADGQPDGQKPKIDADCEVLALDQQGEIWIGDGALQMVKLNCEYAAIGSGQRFALGAMAAGRDAYAAVRIACQFDGGSREPVFGMTNQESA